MSKNTLSNFDYWHNEVADMPANQNGQWVDLETGFTYEDWAKSQTKQRSSINEKAKTARNASKLVGLKPLTGSIKQKNWAEEIRKKFVDTLTQEQLDMVASAELNTASFWIETRYLTAAELLSHLDNYFKIIARHNELLNSAESLVEVNPSTRIITYKDKPLYDKLQAQRLECLQKIEDFRAVAFVKSNPKAIARKAFR